MIPTDMFMFQTEISGETPVSRQWITIEIHIVQLVLQYDYGRSDKHSNLFTRLDTCAGMALPLFYVSAVEIDTCI